MAQRIKQRLIAAHQKRDRVLVDYAILPTEIHLIAQLCGADTPGEVAGAIGNFISRWVREIRPARSPVMSGPFHPSVLESDEAVRHEIRMLAWRPAVLGLCRGPTFHAHGALRSALGLRGCDGFDVRPMLRYFGQDTADARPALGAWVSTRPSALEWKSWELARRLVWAPSHGGPEPTGFKPVKTQGAAALVALAGEGGVEGAIALLADWVAARIGVTDAQQLRSGKDARSVRGRALVARLATKHALCPAALVARHFGKAKATLSEQVSASRARDADTGLVSTPMADILEAIAALKAARARHRGPM